MNLTDEQALEVARTCQVVAVVGMTDGSKPGRASFEIPRMLQDKGIRVLPVNPRVEQALGETSVASVADLDLIPDVYNIFRRGEAIGGLADELIALPAGHRKAVVWLQTGITNPEAEQRLHQAGFKVVSDRCLGVMASLSRHPS